MRNKNAKISDPNKFFTNPGDRYHITFDPKVNPDGTISLVESGCDDIQEMIDSFAEQTDMAFIIKRLQMGDVSVINRNKPMYGDFTDMPKTYAEVLQLNIDAEKQFYTLPLDVRNRFDNDFRQWLAQTGTPDWLEKMNYNTEKEDNSIVDVVEEVKTNES